MEITDYDRQIYEGVSLEDEIWLVGHLRSAMAVDSRVITRG